MTFAEQIVSATREIFDTMIMVDLEVGEPRAIPHGPFASSLSAVVSLTGARPGQVSIHLPNAVAIGLTRDFLGLEVDAIDDDVYDAMGELANMIAGGIKPYISSPERPVELSIPSIIHGTEYILRSLRDAEGSGVPFRVSHGEFLVDLELKKLP